MIAILIPCYNEEKTIKDVILDFKKEVPEAKIYVFDNNSKDKTAEIAKKAGAIVIPEYRQGKGNVVRSMFRTIDADCYVMVDGDNTYPAKHAKGMINLILEKKADMVIGDRLSSTYFTENKRPFHNFGNKIVRSLINKIFKANVRDIMTGYRAFSKQFVRTYPILSKGFEIETEMTIHALDNNFLLKEIPVEYKDRPQGSVSKLNTYKDGIKVLRTIVTLFRDCQPLTFFSIIGFIIFALSTIMFIPVFADYLKTGLVAKFPTLIVAGFLALSAILSFTCGLILSVLRKQHKQMFELELTKYYSNDKGISND